MRVPPEKRRYGQWEREVPGKRQRFFGQPTRAGILLSSPKEESRKVPPFRRGAAGKGNDIPSIITCPVMKNRGTSIPGPRAAAWGGGWPTKRRLRAPVAHRSGRCRHCACGADSRYDRSGRQPLDPAARQTAVGRAAASPRPTLRAWGKGFL